MKTKAEKEKFLNQAREFATVASEFCNFMENAFDNDQRFFLNTGHKLLSLLYLKACLLPDIRNYNSEDIEKFVTEEEWNFIKTVVSSKLKKIDVYTFDEDDNYKPDPKENTSLSEDIADVYQDIKDFISLYNMEVYEMVYDGVAECKNNFKLYWGIKVLNALRAIHKLIYIQNTGDKSINEEFDSIVWDNEDQSMLHND